MKFDELIDLNIRAVTELTKIFLPIMIGHGEGAIMNVASTAAFCSGPKMAVYYASKAYVLNFTEALYEEVKKTNIKVSCLCPGPVDTNFNKVANCEFSIKSLTSKYVAKYAIDKMFKNKLLIIPGFKIRLLYIFGRFVPNKLKLRIAYNVQHNKIN